MRVITEKQKIARREYYKKWYARNKNKVLEKQIIWQRNNLEVFRAYNKKWRENNPDKVRAYENSRKEAKREYGIQWRKNNPDKVKANNAIRRRKTPEQKAVIKAQRARWYQEHKQELKLRRNKCAEKNNL